MVEDMPLPWQIVTKQVKVFLTGRWCHLLPCCLWSNYLTIEAPLKWDWWTHQTGYLSFFVHLLQDTHNPWCCSIKALALPHTMCCFQLAELHFSARKPYCLYTNSEYYPVRDGSQLVHLRFIFTAELNNACKDHCLASHALLCAGIIVARGERPKHPLSGVSGNNSTYTI